MIKKVDTIKKINEGYLYNYSIEPNTFSRVLDIVISNNKNNKTISKNNKKSNVALNSLDIKTKLTIEDRVKFHNSLRKFKNN